MKGGQRPTRRRLDTHICERPKTSESNLPKLPPNAKFYTRWKRNFQKLLLVSMNHPLTRHVLRSHAAIAFEKRRHGRSTFWWAIHPCSDLRFYWDVLMTFTFLYIFLTVPYILTFQRVAKSTDPESWSLVYPAHIISIVDICLNFITGFVSFDGHEVFLDPLLTARHYIRGYFLFDLLSSVPYTWFYKIRIPPPGPNSNSIFLIPECLLLLKLLRIRTLRFYIRQISTNFGISHARDRMIWLVIASSLIIHWCSCLTHFFPLIITHVFGHTMEESRIYLITSELYKKSDSEIYLIYVHMGTSNFFGSSFIEQQTLSKPDKVVRSIILLFGKGYTILLMVLILQLVVSAAEPELKYQRIMHQVKEYIHVKKLPEHLKNKLLAYYEYRFQGSYFKEKAISKTLSNHLNQEIMIHSSRGLIDTSTIFHYLPRNIVANVMGVLRPVIYLKEDIIYKCETEGNCMFFVVSGTVALITFHGKEICHEKDGGYFGEAALTSPDQRRIETVIALEVCELLQFNRRDFKRMFSQKSSFYKRLEKAAKQRHETISKIDSEYDKAHMTSETATVNGEANNVQKTESETSINDNIEAQ